MVNRCLSTKKETKHYHQAIFTSYERFGVHDRQLSSLRQHSKLSDEAATEAGAEAAKLQDKNERLSQQLQDLKQKSSDAIKKAEASSRTHQAEVSAVTFHFQCNMHQTIQPNIK